MSKPSDVSRDTMTGASSCSPAGNAIARSRTRTTRRYLPEGDAVPGAIIQEGLIILASAGSDAKGYVWAYTLSQDHLAWRRVETQPITGKIVWYSGSVGPSIDADSFVMMYTQRSLARIADPTPPNGVK